MSRNVGHMEFRIFATTYETKQCYNPEELDLDNSCHYNPKTQSVTVISFGYPCCRICPYEWTNPYPCIEEPEELENQFTLQNSLWFTIGSLMQQGSEIAPM
jgi:hypothetical protein